MALRVSFLVTLLNRIVSHPAGQVIFGSLFAPNKILCFRLLWIAKNDQRERQACLNGRPWNNQIDRIHTRAMKRIVARYGWPGEKLVGPMGAEAAWLLVQHADHDRAFQKQCHRLLEEAVRRKDAQARHLAYLTDRICVADGVPQIYGTQWGYLIVDPEHVDERRAAVGLSSLEAYLESSRQMLERAGKRQQSSGVNLSEDRE